MSIPKRGTARKELEEALTHALRQQVTLAVVLNTSIASQTGINPTDLQCLGLLILNGPMTPSRLAEALAMTKGGAITAVVDRLEAEGYVRRIRDPADRRQVLVETIPAGPLRQLVARYELLGEALNEIVADFSDEQLKLIHRFTVRSNATFSSALRLTAETQRGVVEPAD